MCWSLCCSCIPHHHCKLVPFPQFSLPRRSSRQDIKMVVWRVQGLILNYGTEFEQKIYRLYEEYTGFARSFPLVFHSRFPLLYTFLALPLQCLYSLCFLEIYRTLPGCSKCFNSLSFQSFSTHMDLLFSAPYSWLHFVTQLHLGQPEGGQVPGLWQEQKSSGICRAASQTTGQCWGLLRR